MSEKNFKKFLISNLAKGLVGFVLIIAFIFLFQEYSPPEYKELLEPFTSRPLLMFGIFLTSETIIGIIPPEFFIVWSMDDHVLKFVFYVTLLSLISFGGALLNYGLGRLINKRLFFQRIAKTTIERYAPYYYKWGGWIIVIAAFTPIPYATMSLVSGALNYPIKDFLLYASSRFLRFGIYSWIIFHAF